MNYQRIYNEIIEKGKLRGLNKKKLEGYFEVHHIVPVYSTSSIAIGMGSLLECINIMNEQELFHKKQIGHLLFMQEDIQAISSINMDGTRHFDYVLSVL